MRRCATTLEAEMTPEEHDLLLSLVRQEQRTGPHLEIGTAAGGTLLEMMSCFPAEQRPPFVVVDPMTYFPNQLDTVRSNLSNHGLDPAAVDFRLQTSEAALSAALARQETFDFMLIDGCHKILAVMNDLRWTRLLRVGGVVCFHDYTWQHKGVYLAVNRFLATHRNYGVVGRAGSLLALRKLAASPRPEVSVAEQLYSWLLYLPLQVERKLHRLTASAKRAA